MLLQPLPFAVLQYLGNIFFYIFTFIDSLSCGLQDEVNIMGYCAARAS